MNLPDISDLRQRQALPLRAKVLMSQNRIREWYNHWNGDVMVCFSGGKDSTVLAHLVHDIYPDVPLVFANTGLEYPEIQSFARKMGAEFVRPRMRFDEVISQYGYPLISKEVSLAICTGRKLKQNKEWRDMPNSKRNELLGYRTFIENKNGEMCERQSHYNKTKWMPLCNETQFRISDRCCYVIKKTPIKKYQKETKRKPMLGTLADESKLRTIAWLKNGCNAYDSKNGTSQPLSFWREQDILQFIWEEAIEIASVYGEVVSTDKNGFGYEPIPGIECNLKCTGCQRTGCMFCGFGAHFEKGETRFQRLSRTHPRQYEYCLGGGQWVDNPDYDPTAPKMDGDWQNWNPKKIWVPSKEGLGMKHVFDECNRIYGKDFIRYE